MQNFDVIPGNKAVAYGVKLARVEVIPAYPITPQTTIIEYLSDFVANGQMDAEYIHSEGEHSCLGMAVGASMAGARTFTATCSHGLAYAHEVLAQATGYRTPFVMAVTNRTLGWYWSIGPDYSDVEPELNLGWIVNFVESNQEAMDMVLQLYKIAENHNVMLPAMMNLDGFYLSYSNERVEIPDQDLVDSWLPPFKPPYSIDPTEHRVFPAAVIPQQAMTGARRQLEEALQETGHLIEEVSKSFGDTFGRYHSGLVEEYKVEGAEAILVTIGSMTTAARRAVDRLRSEGEKIGLIKIRFVRPFPASFFKKLSVKLRAIGVLDRMIQHGTNGGMIFNDVKSAISNTPEHAPVINFITGIGGEDIPIDDIISMGRKTLKVAEAGITDSEVEFVEHEASPPVIPIKCDTDSEMNPSSLGCGGCGASIILRQIMDEMGKNTIIVNPPSCGAINYPSVVKVPWVLSNFAAGASYQTGIYRALKVKGKLGKVNVIGYAGDGGTVDIGLQSLSGAAERGESMIWVCYDNEAYMNTGIQRSGSTPQFSATTTTPSGSLWAGKPQRRKNMVMIMAAHRIPYIATASLSYLPDLKRKIRRAKEITENGEGLAFLHVHQPCTTGWYFPPEMTVEMGRLAVQTGAWPIMEVDHGAFKLNVKPKELKPITEYLKPQKRFRHLNEEHVNTIQEFTIKDWEMLLELDKIGRMPGY